MLIESRMPDMSDILEANYKNLERVNTWIENADRKASIILAFNGGLLAILSNKIDRSPTIVDSVDSWFIITLSLIFLTVFLICFGLSIYHALRVLLPNISCASNKHMLFYFASIAELSREGFIEKMSKNLSEEEVLQNLAEQTYLVSCIAKDKFDHMTRSWQLLAASIAPGILLLSLLVLI